LGKSIGKYAWGAVPVCLLAVLTALIVGFYTGVLNIPVLSDLLRTEPADTDPHPGLTAPPATEPISNISGEGNTDNIGESAALSPPLPLYDAAMKGAGWRVSGDRYDLEDGAQYSFARAQPGGILPSAFDYDIPWSREEKDGNGEIVTVEGEDRKPFVEVKMGFIFVYDGAGDAKVYTPEMSLVLDSLADVEFPVMRDPEGNPIFLINREAYYYDLNEQKFVLTAYFPPTMNRGVPFMYPSYYGAAGDSGLIRYAEKGKWGYLNIESGKTAIAPGYDFAYNFSGGLSVAVKYDSHRGNRLFILDVEGNTLNSTYFDPDPTKNTKIRLDLNQNFFLPDNLGEGDIGYCYFDHGLTRADSFHLPAYPQLLGNLFPFLRLYPLI